MSKRQQSQERFERAVQGMAEAREAELRATSEWWVAVARMMMHEQRKNR